MFHDLLCINARCTVSTVTCTGGWGHADNSHQRSKQSGGAVRLLHLLSLQWVGFVSAPSAPPASALPTREALHNPQRRRVSCSAIVGAEMLPLPRRSLLGSVLLL